MYRSIALLLFFLSALNGFTPASHSPRRVDYASLSTFPVPVGLSLSPDGKLLLLTTFGPSAQTGQPGIQHLLMDTLGQNRRLLPPDLSSPRFSRAEGLLYALSEHEGASWLTRIDPRTLATQRLHPLPEEAGDILLLPDGSGLLYTRKIQITNPRRPGPRPHSGLTYDGLLMRVYNRWNDGKVNHIFLHRFSGGSDLDLTPGPHSAPTTHLGSEQDWDLSPDGRTLTYVSNTDPVKALSTNNDIHLVHLDGSGHQVLSTSKGNDGHPSFSPDGRYLAYTEMATPGYESEQKDLVLVDLKQNGSRNLTRDLDLSVDRIIWGSRSRHLFIVCKEKGYDAVYRLRVSDGALTRLIHNRILGSINISPDGKTLWATTSSTDRPAELARVDLPSGRTTLLTRLAEPFMATHALGKTRTIWFRGAHNDPVQAFVTFPPGMDFKKRYPLVFLFHGGPEGDWDGSWSGYVANPQLLAARDLIVVKPNLHAATSFGRAFEEAIQGQWGVVDQQDVDACLDHLLSAYPCIDPARIGAVGRSYGGFLVNWLNGNSRRFSCFVCIDGLFDQIMMYWSTDELWFPEKEFGGSPLDNPQEYLRASPSTYARNFATPTLILHGGSDYRVDLSQGLAMHTALQKKGVPSRLIVFPEEGHYFRSPDNWAYAYGEILDWLDRYLKTAPSARQPDPEP